MRFCTGIRQQQRTADRCNRDAAACLQRLLRAASGRQLACMSDLQAKIPEGIPSAEAGPRNKIYPGGHRTDATRVCLAAARNASLAWPDATPSPLIRPHRPRGCRALSPPLSVHCSKLQLQLILLASRTLIQVTSRHC